MEIFLTIISALIIFILSQFFLELVLKPFIRYRETVFNIDTELKFYMNRLNSSDVLAKKEELFKIVDATRKLSCDLEASYKQILFRKFLIGIDFIPKKGNVGDASSRLIRVSNSIGIRNPGGQGNYEDVKEIRKLLRIEPLVD